MSLFLCSPIRLTPCCSHSAELTCFAFAVGAALFFPFQCRLQRMLLCELKIDGFKFVLLCWTSAIVVGAFGEPSVFVAAIAKAY